MSHDVDWYSPAPFWPELLPKSTSENGTSEGGTNNRMRTPELLQFGQDDFMGALQKTLEDNPNALPAKSAKWEEYPERDDSDVPEDGAIPLYQPAHERYYLVTASLVCRERGLPDRAVDTTSEERAAFVLRRVEEDPSGTTTLDGKTYTEYRWTGTAWEPVQVKTRVTDAEKQIAMFPQSYAPQTPVEQIKGKRRIWAGLIPVAKRDTFETAPVRRNGTSGTSANGDSVSDGSGSDGSDSSAPTSFAPKDDPLRDPRKVKFDTEILGAFRQVHTLLGKPQSSVTAEDVRDPIVFAWYDFWTFLGEHLKDVRTSIIDEETAEEADFQADNEGDSNNRASRKEAVLHVLNSASVDQMGLGDKAADALRTFDKKQNRKHVEAGRLHKVLDADDLPKHEVKTEGGKDVEELDRDKLKDAFNQLLHEKIGGEEGKERTDGTQEPALKTVVNRALGSVEDAGSLPDDLQPPTTDPVGGGTYVVRCLYERPKCPKPIRMTVSKPSERFRLASFFDAKAPPRDISITLPSASMQDLRDSSKSFSMVFTKELRKQAERVQNVTLEKMQEGDVGKAPTVDIGMICSLSIPIITICALILLLIIVVLLNIVFWWLPFFKICFPIPKSS